MIFIYKTDIEQEFDVESLKPRLDVILGAASWSIDLDNNDKILKIDSDNVQNVIHSLRIISDLGFHCSAF